MTLFTLTLTRSTTAHALHRAGTRATLPACLEVTCVTNVAIPSQETGEAAASGSSSSSTPSASASASGAASESVLAQGMIQGVRHRELVVEGVQFHPESILTEHGHAMLRNFLAWDKAVR